MGLKIDILKKNLEDEDCLKLLNHCIEPKTFNEIKKIKIKDSKLFNILIEMKIAEALLFADGKYYTTKEAQEFLKLLHELHIEARIILVVCSFEY